MRLHIFSDLHLEFAPFDPPEVEADVVVIAGDVHPGFEGLDWLRARFHRIPVIYVLGNHEFYGKAIPKLTFELKERARGSNIHILENDRLQIGDVTFLGATLWTDFELYGTAMDSLADAAFQMTDYRRIRVAPKYTKFRPRDSRWFHEKSKQWLLDQVGNHGGERTVVVTHHAPSRQSFKLEQQDRPVNPAYASNLEAFVAVSRVPLWVHGHIHHASDYVIGETRVLANPRGYPHKKATGFNPGLIVEV